MNSISHILAGKGGNTVRFNFTNGNIITKKLAELTLRGKYYQDLLEDSDLFKRGLVRLSHSVKEASDKEETKAKEETSADESKAFSVPEVRTSADLIAYVNEHYDKSFRTVSNALDFATTKQNLCFPNYNPA